MIRLTSSEEIYRRLQSNNSAPKSCVGVTSKMAIGPGELFVLTAVVGSVMCFLPQATVTTTNEVMLLYH